MKLPEEGLTLVTGAAGFIGFHCARRLMAEGLPVLGADNLNDYYDVSLKEARRQILATCPGFHFERIDLSDRAETARLFTEYPVRRVVHLAAQAGVRYSLVNPHAYVDSNLVAFVNVLEWCRARGVEHLIFASSSSVYGSSKRMPFSVHDNVDHPISLYAATKKANELMAHTYSHLFGIPSTALRLFTVYGPWGRPDMAVFGFTKAILEGEPIDLYNHGRMKRDFTYVDDVAESIARLLPLPPRPDAGWDPLSPDPGTSFAPYKVYNVGNHEPVELLEFVATLEKALSRKAVTRLLPMQPGDVLETYADVDDLIRTTGFQPSTPLEVGLGRFVDWYREYYRIER
jgi:UDP-glucuronate 4-epimerase